MTLFTLAVLLASHAQAADPHWTFEQIGPSAQGNRQINVKISPDQKINVVYTGCSDVACKNDELFLATKPTQGGKWELTSVDAEKGKTGWTPSLLIKADGTLRVAYDTHFKMPTLQYAEKAPGGEWKKSSIGPTPGGYWTSMAQAGETLYVANTSLPTGNINSSALEVATLTRAGWSFEKVDESAGAGWLTSIALGQDGLPWVSYIRTTYPNGDLVVTHKTADGKWVSDEVDVESIKSSLSMDSKGFAHMVYSRLDDKYMKTTDLFYATNSPDGNWTTQKIEGGEYSEQNTGFHPHLTFDAKGGMHVLYSDSFHVNLMYARNLGDGWKTYNITRPRNDGFYAWGEFDAKGVLHVAYDTGYTLMYARCENCMTP